MSIPARATRMLFAWSFDEVEGSGRGENRHGKHGRHRASSPWQRVDDRECRGDRGTSKGTASHVLERAGNALVAKDVRPTKIGSASLSRCSVPRHLSSPGNKCAQVTPRPPGSRLDLRRAPNSADGRNGRSCALRVQEIAVACLVVSPPGAGDKILLDFGAASIHTGAQQTPENGDTNTQAGSGAGSLR